MFNKSDKKLLIKILKMSQHQLKFFVYSKLLELKFDNVQFNDGYVYAKGDLPIMLVSHLDTVGTRPPTDILYNNVYMTAIDSILGGDDRNGIFTIIKLLEKGYRPHVLFTEDEEIGGIGARKFTKDYPTFVGLKYIIQLDRRGENDCVFYNCGNLDFVSYIESFGFSENFGTFSDISTICPQYDIAGVNLSIGYYNEHSVREYTNLTHLYKTYTRVQKMLDDIPNSQFFDMQEIEYPQTGYVQNNTFVSGRYIWRNGRYMTYEEYYKEIYPEYFDQEDGEDKPYEEDACDVLIEPDDVPF